MTNFTTITDLTDAIRAILGDYADSYDVEGIARAVVDYDENGNVVADLDRPDFYGIADSYDTTTYDRYFAHVNRMILVQEDEIYVERDEDARTGSCYAEAYFDTEDEAVAFVNAEMADYDARELGGKGYKIYRRRALDTIAYAEGAVERHRFSGIDDEVIDYDEDADYHVCSLPDEVREKADAIMREYHRYLDHQGDSYGRLSDEFAA